MSCEHEWRIDYDDDGATVACALCAQTGIECPHCYDEGFRLECGICKGRGIITHDEAILLAADDDDDTA